MTESIWKSITRSTGIKRLARVPMSEADRQSMREDYEEDYSDWVIALIEEPSGWQTLVAWGLDGNGMSDSDIGHLSVESPEGGLDGMWYQWLLDARESLRG